MKFHPYFIMSLNFERLFSNAQCKLSIVPLTRLMDQPASGEKCGDKHPRTDFPSQLKHFQMVLAATSHLFTEKTRSRKRPLREPIRGRYFLLDTNVLVATTCMRQERIGQTEA
mmetsp:Transcript_18342/g.23613  ORF Transcript_18342/g.23613 Transcript_18342/m.23613 type:complete len:113 (+) Transcript_18342:247-585(+)